MNNPDLNKLARETAREISEWEAKTYGKPEYSHPSQLKEQEVIHEIILSALTRATEHLYKLLDEQGARNWGITAPASAEQQDTWEHKIADFVNSILHGDDIHKTWLREAGEAFILGKPLPPPRDGKSGLRCVYCGLSAQELKPPHYLKRINRLGDTPSKWICTEHQYIKGEVRHDLLDDSHYFGRPKPAQPQKERTGQ